MKKGGVTYSQNDTLEQSCYDELSMCDIVVCVIGNKYGTKSDVGNYSITMEELQKAIIAKKKVYTFIIKDVFIENSTYEKNISKGSFEPAYVDNIKIHEFISQLKKTVRNYPILPFESVNEIINNLKLQFSGLFQKLLTQESSATEQKTFYDLQAISLQIKEQVNSFTEQRDSFFTKFDSTIFASNRAIYRLKEILGLTECSVFIPTRSALKQFMEVIGFIFDDSFDAILDDKLTFTRTINSNKEVVFISENLFTNEGKIKDIRTAADAEKHIIYSREVCVETDEELPF